MVRSRTLTTLLAHSRHVDARLVEESGSLISGITHDHRNVAAGDLFCCVRGERFDGHAFAADAIAAGASALLCEMPIAPSVLADSLARRGSKGAGAGVSVAVVDDVRRSMGFVAAGVYDHPSDRLTVVGVTGTNGKTTTSHLLGDVLSATGWPTEVIGTLSGAHTTPEGPVLQRRLAEAIERGTGAVAMEVSSHALELHRVNGTRFRVAVFTNLGRDHMDFHGSLERYFAAKARLFEPELADIAVINADDVHGRLLIDSARIPVAPFSLADVTDLVVTPLEHSYTWKGVSIRAPIGGRFNVLNSLAAATAALALDLSPQEISAAFGKVTPVPGRFEARYSPSGVFVLIDYAHTPEALEAALQSAAAATEGRVIVVFGCGGDRDRDKRPVMGSVAATHADVVVVTSDNPRTEDPGEIIGSILDGVPEEYRRRILVEPDRAKAIEAALVTARPGDVVVVAGKGHETTQTIGAETVVFDDRVVVDSILEGLA